MTINFTVKEEEVLKVFFQEGVEISGASNTEEMLCDNMSYCSANDLKKNLGWSKQVIGGVMASLSEKGMINDTGESPRGDSCTDWYLTDEGIPHAYESWKF